MTIVKKIKNWFVRSERLHSKSSGLIKYGSYLVDKDPTAITKAKPQPYTLCMAMLLTSFKRLQEKP